MKHVHVESRWIVWFLCACLGMGASCHILVRRVPQELVRLKDVSLTKPSGVQSTATSVRFSYHWPEDDSETKTFYFVVPPEVNITPDILSYKLGRVAGNARTDSGPAASPARPESLSVEMPVLARQISIKDCGFVRFNRLVEVKVEPKVRGVPAAEGILLREVEVALRFDKPYETQASVVDNALADTSWGFGNILATLVANPEACQRYATASPPISADLETETWVPWTQPGMGPWLKVVIEKPGFYTIDQEFLQTAGLDPHTIHPHLIRIYNQGREVPVCMLGGFAQAYTPNDHVVFYGTPSSSKYTVKNVYWVTVATEGNGLAMPLVAEASESSPPVQAELFFYSHRVVEEDQELKMHTGRFLTIRQMRWVWEALTPDAPVTINFDLPGLYSMSGDARIGISFFFDPIFFTSHEKVHCILNDAIETDWTFAETSDDQKYLELPYEALREHGNTLRFIESLEEGEETPVRPAVYLDRIELVYPRRFAAVNDMLAFTLDAPSSGTLKYVRLTGFSPQPLIGFDITDPEQPQVVQASRQTNGSATFRIWVQGKRQYEFLTLARLEDASVLEKPPAFANLHSATNGADYLIISHEKFLGVLSPLVELKEAQGLRTKVIDVEAIYNEFNAGLESPVAIKAFLAHALRHWETRRPTYVLLVGDSTSYYRGETRNEAINYVPSFSYQAGETAQDKWASDHWYTTVAGTDALADIILGRLSVNSVEDAQTVVEKIVHYTQRPKLGPWRTTLGYVAEKGVFDRECEDLRANYTPRIFRGETVYEGKLPWEDNFYLPLELMEKEKAKVSPITTTKILEMLNNGVLFLTFYGHGSPNVWTDEHIWFGGGSPNSDNLHLRNRDVLPFIINMTCNSGAIDYPVPPWNVCISEDFMRVKDGGAIGLYVPAGPGFTSVHKNASIALRQAFFYDRFRRLGDAIVAADYHYLLKGHEENMVRMFILLGDPALELQMPAETLELEVSEPVVRQGSVQSVKITGRTERISEGQVTYSLYTPSNELFGETTTQHFTNGHLAYTFTVPETAMRGEWTVYTYYWNSEQGRDAMGVARFAVDTPFVTLNDFKPVNLGRELAAGDVVELQATVQNRSAFQLPDVQARIVQRSADEEEKTQTQVVALEPYQAKELRFHCTVAESLNLFTAAILNYVDPPDALTARESDKTVGLGVKRPMTETGLAVAGELCEKEMTIVGSRLRIQFRVPVFNIGTKDVRGEVSLSDEAGNELNRIEKLFRASQTPLGERILIASTISPEQTNQTLTFAVGMQDQSGEKIGEVQQFRYTLDLRRLPDLMITPDDVKFNNPTPTEGVTVFIDVTVHNNGVAAAQNIQVTAYDGDPESGGEPLESFVQGNWGSLAYLAPGGTADVSLRWDPVKNLGDHEIFVKVDPSDRVLETDESNNVASLELRVKSKAILVPRGITILEQTPEERQQHVARLAARVKNAGETEARNVFVEFYSSYQQTEENKLGEVLIEEIQPGETQTAIYRWQAREEDLYHAVRPSYKIFLKGSLQRISSVDHEQE